MVNNFKPDEYFKQSVSGSGRWAMSFLVFAEHMTKEEFAEEELGSESILAYE